MRMSHIIVSLPVLLCVAQLSHSVSQAQAGPMDATTATELLAKSNAINVKCNVLAADQAQDLKDFVARAEISLAEKASVAAARKAIANGKSQGKAAICDEAANKLVKDVLAAASAAAVAPVEDQSVAATPAEPAQAAENAVAVVEPVQPAKQTKTVKPITPDAKVKVAKAIKAEKPAKQIKTGKTLQGYASVAEKYYMAARCGGMSRSEINSLYKKVLVNHQQALAANRPQEVRAMLQSAEARAASKSCG
jgi:hypothetical protein